MIEVITIIIGIIIFVLVGRHKSKKNVNAIIDKFKDKNALNKDNALTKNELGITHKNKKTFRNIIFKDYGEETLEVLINSNIVKRTEDGRYYLVNCK